MKHADLITFIQTLDKNEFETYYKNNSNKKVLEYFNIKEHELKNILSFLNIKHKTKKETATLIK